MLVDDGGGTHLEDESPETEIEEQEPEEEESVDEDSEDQEDDSDEDSEEGEDDGEDDIDEAETARREEQSYKDRFYALTQKHAEVLERTSSNDTARPALSDEDAFKEDFKSMMETKAHGPKVRVWAKQLERGDIDKEEYNILCVSEVAAYRDRKAMKEELESFRSETQITSVRGVMKDALSRYIDPSDKAQMNVVAKVLKEDWAIDINDPKSFNPKITAEKADRVVKYAALLAREQLGRKGKGTGKKQKPVVPAGKKGQRLESGGSAATLTGKAAKESKPMTPAQVTAMLKAGK